MITTIIRCRIIFILLYIKIILLQKKIIRRQIIVVFIKFQIKNISAIYCDITKKLKLLEELAER